MQVYPTKPAVHLALSGTAVVLAAIIAREPLILAWGAALVFSVALARAAGLISVARIRSAGFEMLWSTEQRVSTVARGGELEIDAEVRNRDTRAARYVHLRPVASANLEVSVEPSSGEVPAGGRLCVTVRVKAPRVGRFALHGLSLEVQGVPGLFEVPLTFANPYGIEVLPRAFSWLLNTARGGRSRMGAEMGRPGPLPGDGTELRELREHQPGDPFRRIAWRASAKRGKLLVRDFEKEERDIAWIILDASVELWAGPPGRSAMDVGIDEVASIARQHLTRGDRVGLAVIGGRVLALIEPDRGPQHAMHIALGLLLGSSTYDADRSDLDEREVAARVIEHLRPLDSKLADVGRRDLDKLAFRAEAAMSRAPFRTQQPNAPSPREATLRHYMASFGMDAPARTEPDRNRTDEAIARMLERIAQRKPRASVVHVWAPAPDSPRADLQQAFAKLRRTGAQIRWIPARYEQSVETADSPVGKIVSDAIIMRARSARERGESVLRRMGIRIEHMKRRSHNVLESNSDRSSLLPVLPSAEKDS